MKGFNTKFTDFPNYIIDITKEIWEDRGVATIDDYYAKDIIVRSPNALVQGSDNVIAATMATLSEFPDRRLLGEDVIWSGTPEEGMLSSHRILSTATHTGDGVYGKATGKSLCYRVLADCYAINNQIADEWLIRDQGAIVRQLGWKPIDFARDLIEREGGIDHCTQPFTAAIDIAGPYQQSGNDHEAGEQLCDILMRMMNADFSVIVNSYDRAANLFYPGGLTTYSHDGADAFWMGLRASFPSAKFSINHVIGMSGDDMPKRAAVRWSLDGKHDGWGTFGKPTHAHVHIMGITHVEFGAWGLRREYTLFDEPMIYKQILLKK